MIERKIVGKYCCNLDDRLGSGAFAPVFKGSLADDPGALVAVKMIPINFGSEEELVKSFLEREINVMQRVMMNIEHENILKLYDVVITKNNIYLFKEFCNEGDLEGRKRDLSLEESLIILKQITEAMCTAIKLNFIHGDIKPANILIHNGKAKIEITRTLKDLQDLLDSSKKIERVLFTPLYMAPQIYTEKKYGEKCDVWSLGVLFYELIYKKPPWYGKDRHNLFRNIKEQPLNLEHDDPDQEPDDDIKDLIIKMLRKTEEKRIDFQGILEHEVFRRKIPDELPKRKWSFFKTKKF